MATDATLQEERNSLAVLEYSLPFFLNNWNWVSTYISGFGY